MKDCIVFHDLYEFYGFDKLEFEKVSTKKIPRHSEPVRTLAWESPGSSGQPLQSRFFRKLG